MFIENKAGAAVTSVDRHGTGHATPSAANGPCWPSTWRCFTRCPTHPEKTRSSIGMVATSQHCRWWSTKNPPANDHEPWLLKVQPGKFIHGSAAVAATFISADCSLSD
jgi:hypothetical protein